MGKKFKKWLCVVLAVVLMASALPLIAGAIAPSGESAGSASSSGQGPLKVEISSDKDRYTLLGKMAFTATITNTSSDTVENISAEALFGASLRPLAKGSQLIATKDSLAPGASFSFTYYADLNGLKGIDNLLLPVFWLSSLLHGGKAEIGNGNGGTDYVEASKAVGLVSLFSGQYDVSTSVRVYYGGADMSVFRKFMADTHEILVGQNKQVVFSATLTEIGLSGSVRVVTSSGAVVGELKANSNGVYTGKFTLSSSTEKTETYYAKIADKTSAPFDILFYTELTESDFDQLDEIDEHLESLRTNAKRSNMSNEALLNQVYTYLVGRGDVHSISKSTDNVAYTTSAGIRAMFVIFGKGNQGGISPIRTIELEYDSVDTVTGIPLAVAQTYVPSSPNLYENYPVLTHKRITVVRPFFGINNENALNSSAPVMVANLIASDFDCTVQTYDAENATIEAMKTFGDSGIIFIDGHGMFDKETQFPIICLTQKLTRDIKNSADYKDGRIIPIGNNQIGVSPRFFVRYYPNNEMENALVYLGLCYGMQNYSLAAGFIFAGAKVVIGYSGIVNAGYNGPMLNTIMEEMRDVSSDINRGKTVSEAITTAKARYGNYDPFNPKTEIRLTGTENHFNYVLWLRPDYDDPPFLSTITGKVIEQGTNAPLSGVLVQAMKTGSTTVVASDTTNASGQYSLSVDGNDVYDIKFTKAGYFERARLNFGFAGSTIALDNVTMVLTGNEEPNPSDYDYTKSGNGVIITRYRGNGRHVVIPSSIEGSPVIGLGVAGGSGTYVFGRNNNIISVVIPDTVTYLGYGTFYECTNLELVITPNNVTAIYPSAFSGCGKLTDITIRNAGYVDSEAFRSCFALLAINVSASSVTCSSLNGVLFDKSKTRLIAYPAGKSETTYTIPNTVTSIGSWAFDSSANLTSIIVPSSVSAIGLWSFNWCPNLTSMYFWGDAPSVNGRTWDSGDKLFGNTNPNFMIYYKPTAKGWSSPTWFGYKTATW